MTQQQSNGASRFAPNRFVLEQQDATITYDTTAFDGQPHLSYQASHDPTVRAFRGDEIRAQQSEIGTLVTVTLEAIPDGPTTLLTILLPAINLEEAAEQPFVTVGIVTTEQSSIAGPQLVRGAVQSYQIMQFEGIAQFVLT